MALILDTGPLLAAMDRSDRDHVACAQLLESTTEDLVLPAPVLPELDYWFHKGIGPEALPALLDEIRRGVFGFVDAAVLARRHFTIMRPRHVDALELLPTATAGRRRWAHPPRHGA